MMTALVEASAPVIPDLFWKQRGDEPDDVIVARVLAGEKSEFSTLVERYSQRIFRACMAVTKDYDAAEDCLQRTFMQALDNLSQYRGEARFSTWLTRIALNVALSQLRQRTRRQPFVSLDTDIPAFNLVDHAPSPETACFRKEFRKLLERALESLSPRLRLVFLLRDVQELSTEETASILGITEPAVKTRLVRARLKLREILEPKLMPATVS